jgi:ABC-type lipoprotein export system ATPase subunit
VSEPRPIIHLAEIHKSYGASQGKEEVLCGVSLDILAGEMVALVGQSGSGKSTLLNIVGGLDKPDRGDVVVDGHDYAKLDDRALSRLRNERIGFVFQAFHLLEHLSVQENVCLASFFARGPKGAGSDAARAKDALGRVGLCDLAHRMPSVLSGGQKQRVAIARALFHRPALLLCDEPTGNLDSETGRDVIHFFQALNREEGTTLLIVTHEERVSRAAGRVIRIVDGRLEPDAPALVPRSLP